MAAPVKVFISYAREDEIYKNDLKKWLKPYAVNQLIEIWDDSQIPLGGQWDAEIKQAMNNSEVLLFLISHDFMASDYIKKTEIKNALERYNRNEVVIVPIIIRSVDFSYLNLSKFQALPPNAKPVASYNDKDEAWLEVAKRLRALFENLQNRNISSTPTPAASSGTRSDSGTTPYDISKNTSINKTALKEMLADNKVKEVLKLLMERSDLDSDIEMQLTMLSARFNSNRKNMMMGIADASDSRSENAKILYALMGLLDEIS